MYILVSVLQNIGISSKHIIRVFFPFLWSSNREIEREISSKKIQQWCERRENQPGSNMWWLDQKVIQTTYTHFRNGQIKYHPRVPMVTLYPPARKEFTVLESFTKGVCCVAYDKTSINGFWCSCHCNTRNVSNSMKYNGKKSFMTFDGLWLKCIHAARQNVTHPNCVCKLSF